MRYQNLELFNIRSVEENCSASGVRLARLPENVRNKLNARARLQGANANCGEIRFVTEAPHFLIRIMARKMSTWPQPINPMMRVMVGNIEYSRIELPFDQMVSIPFDLWTPENIRPEVLRPNPEFGFDSKVWRFVLPGAEIIFGGLETYGFPVRPPTPAEQPAFRCLCHGSSITNSYIEGWPALVGHYLGIDTLNLGLAGSCLSEHEISDYLSDERDFQYAVLELGINSLWMEKEVFAERVDYLLKQLTGKRPDLKIAMITLFPFSGEGALQIKDTEKNGKTEQFREIIRDAVKRYRDNGVDIFKIEGPEVDIPSKCWSFDLIHPRYVGNSFMAFKIGEIIKQKWFPSALF